MNKLFIISTTVASIGLLGCDTETGNKIMDGAASQSEIGFSDLSGRHTPEVATNRVSTVIAPASVVTALDAASVFEDVVDATEFALFRGNIQSNRGRINCALQSGGGNGSIQYLFDDSDSNRILSSGDRVALDFQNCASFAEQEVLNGSTEILLRNRVGNPEFDESFSFSTDVQLRDLTVLDAMGGFNRVTGMLSLEVGSRNSITETVSSTASFLTIDSEDGQETISDAFYTATQSNIVDDVSFSLTGNVETTTRERLRIDQEVPWRFLNGEDFPSEGRIVIRSENGPVFYANTLGPEFINVQVDGNGDDIPEEVRDWSWEEIDNI